MPDYPSKIRPAQFADVNVPAPFNPGPVQACNAPPQCAITQLWLSPASALPQSFNPNNNPEVAAADRGRYRVAPTVDDIRIHWELSGREYVESLELELYRHDDIPAVPLWTKKIDFAGLAAKNGDTPFNSLDDLPVERACSDPSAAAPVIARHYVPTEFPDDCLTVEHSPYKLKATITPRPGNVATYPVRWLYIDVLVGDILLELGPGAIVPNMPFIGMPAERQDFERRNQIVHAELAQQLAGSMSIDAGGDALQVLLESNVFGRDSWEWYSNAFFSAYAALWGDGPIIPIIARVQVRDAAGASVDAPRALGNARFLWDWEGAKHSPGTIPDKDVKAFLADAVHYKPGDWPHGLDNCHVDHGGKRGPGSSPVFEPNGAPVDSPQAANGYAKNTVNPIAAQMPFKVEAAGTRTWAAYSYARTEGLGAGQTGVPFRPSRIVGDGYTLTCYFAPSNVNLDVANRTAAELRADAGTLPHATSREFTVRRLMQVARHWKKTAAIQQGIFSWDRVKALLGHTGIELRVPPAASVVVAVDYQNAFQRSWDAIHMLPRCACLPPAQQDVNDWGVNFRDYAQFVAEVEAHVHRCRGFITSDMDISHNAIVLRQRTGLGIHTRLWYSDDLILEDANLLGKPDQEIAKALLKEHKLTSEKLYKEKCKEWSSTILHDVCDELTDPDIEGLHLFQFDYQDNFLNWSMAAEAYTSRTNRTTCRECANVLTVKQREERECACGTRLRGNSGIVSIYPWSRYQDARTWREQGFALLGKMVGATPEISMTHEIGHHLFMPHAPPGTSKAGSHPTFHDDGTWTCIMSYNVAQASSLTFCGLCTLRIRGWSMGATPAPTGNEVATALAQPQQSARDPLLLAVDPDAAEWIGKKTAVEIANSVPLQTSIRNRVQRATRMAQDLRIHDAATVPLHNRARQNRHP
ncbi:hypothetical protein [Pyxidicoccus caerfyrddinensis]|uniref:hypothetical protein n=1 Tax=Pyxidicoccus caerfyrddinensis TaxID=2709663 RepID=UPI0013DA78C8|nr:hypothetical protein [Pyxidicoccus caerfyrddinensis]